MVTIHLGTCVNAKREEIRRKKRVLCKGGKRRSRTNLIGFSWNISFVALSSKTAYHTSEQVRNNTMDSVPTHQSLLDQLFRIHKNILKKNDNKQQQKSIEKKLTNVHYM